MYALVIRNGILVNADGVTRGDLAVHHGQIAAVGTTLVGKRTIDATDCYVLPGAIDPHVHLQMPLAGRVSADSFATGTVAAACGGTTTVIDFVEPQVGQSMLEALEQRRSEATGQVAVDFGLHMTVPTWHASQPDGLNEVAAAVAAGCPTFKMYQAYAGMMLDDVALLRALTAVGEAGGRTVLHSETGPVLEYLRAEALAEGHVEPIWHAYTRPASLEASAIYRAAELAELASCPLYIFHVGCQEGVLEILRARQRRIDIWGETCPQYLLLNAEEHLGGLNGELFVCAPPLRSVEDNRMLWQALAQDSLQVVSTDHCPWSVAEKAQPDFTQIPGGVPSIEARLALVHHFGVNQGLLTLERWVQVCATNAARWMGLGRKGRLAPGCDADLVIFDPQRVRYLAPDTLHEAAGWSPYEGIEVCGWPRTVLLRGKVIVEDEQYIGTQNDGQFVARRLATPPMF
jgi:dihydropyrimidinase